MPRRVGGAQPTALHEAGVAPDIEVEQWPAEVMSGKDPQLERAIEEIMRSLKANPPVDPKRPPFEKRGSAGY